MKLNTFRELMLCNQEWI